MFSDNIDCDIVIGVVDCVEEGNWCFGDNV